MDRPQHHLQTELKKGPRGLFFSSLRGDDSAGCGALQDCFFPAPQTSSENAMTEFSNVSVLKKANVYFDGKVTSRTVVFPDGAKKTLGIMLPGEYEFGTAEKELMEIQSGDLDVLLPGETVWKTFGDGTAFNVPANSKFSLKVRTLTDYCCSFLK
jgi:purine/pyrimidine-nucleoside phosphorylase